MSSIETLPSQAPKFRLTEEALNLLTRSGSTPEDYARSSTSVGGLQLFNAGSEVKIYGRNKFVAFEEKNIAIKTGVKLALSEGQMAMISPQPSLLATSLLVNPLLYGPGDLVEVIVSFMNMGEKDVVVPAGATLPAQLVVFSGVQTPELISDLEYLKTTENLTHLKTDKE